MNLDPIVEEIHEIRDKLSQQYGNDLHTICEAFRSQQNASQHLAISRTPRPAVHIIHTASNPLLQRIGCDTLWSLR
jgi:hypothetical protein